MKVPFQQNTISGCGSYSLANFFNDESYIQGIETLTVGESTYDLNKKLDKISNECYLGSIFCTQSSFLPPNNRLNEISLFDIDWNKITNEQKATWVYPLLVTFKRTKEKCHCILVLHELSTNLLHIVDSLREDVIISTIENFIADYPILEVLNFNLGFDNPNNSMMCIKSYFTHLINESIN